MIIEGPWLNLPTSKILGIALLNNTWIWTFLRFSNAMLIYHLLSILKRTTCTAPRGLVIRSQSRVRFLWFFKKNVIFIYRFETVCTVSLYVGVWLASHKSVSFSFGLNTVSIYLDVTHRMRLRLAQYVRAARMIYNWCHWLADMLRAITRDSSNYIALRLTFMTVAAVITSVYASPYRLGVCM